MPSSRDNINERIVNAIRTMLGLIWVATVRVSIDPASIAAEASGDTTLTVTGALLGDFVMLGWETDRLTGVNLAAVAYVSAADTVTVHLTNNNVAAGAAIDLAATTVQCTVLRRG